MKKGIYATFLLGSLVLSLIALAGCSSSQQPQSGTSVRVVSLDASWAKIYHSFAGLKHDADLAVQGTVTQVRQTVSPTDGTPRARISSLPSAGCFRILPIVSRATRSRFIKRAGW